LRLLALSQCERASPPGQRRDARAPSPPQGYDLKILEQLLSSSGDGVGDVVRPAVIFIEVGLLSAADQARAAALVEAEGYVARRCGYGMEMLATRAVGNTHPS